MFLKNFSCIIKTTRQDWYQHTWNWSSKSHSRTTPEVFLVFHCISSLGIACKSRNISHFRISNRPTERWNLFILCHKEANLIFLEVNFVQLLLITICIIFLIETSFLGRKTHLIYILTWKIVSLLLKSASRLSFTKVFKLQRCDFLSTRNAAPEGQLLLETQKNVFKASDSFKVSKSIKLLKLPM